ncbi:MAG: hypothetical protein EXQ53_07230 [Acidobacteria bacterium]|nr:hypothetical protein [Acidobacteriota bacterium]
MALKSGGGPGAAVEVTTPRFGKKDWRGIEFDDTVPSRFVSGQRVTLAGRVTATDRSDFNTSLLRFWKYGGNSANAVLVQGELTRSGTLFSGRRIHPGAAGPLLDGGLPLLA